MDLLIGLLTFVLVLNCTLLILLILIQLPKKEAGAGLAFGGAASDALFGAGTGTVLTKITRHATTFFLVLAFTLSVMQSYRARHKRDSILDQLDSRATAVQPAAVPEQAPTLTITNAAVPAAEAAAPVTDSSTTNAAAGEPLTDTPAAAAPEGEPDASPPAPPENP